MVWIVRIDIFFFVCGHLRREKAVPSSRIGMTGTMQIIRAIPGIGKRPVVLFAPLIQAHDKDLDGLFLLYSVVFAFEPVIEPAQLQTHQIDRLRIGRWAIVAFREQARRHGVGPGTDHKPLVLPGYLASSTLLHVEIVV